MDFLARSAKLFFAQCSERHCVLAAGAVAAFCTKIGIHASVLTVQGVATTPAWTRALSTGEVSSRDFMGAVDGIADTDSTHPLHGSGRRYGALVVCGFTGTQGGPGDWDGHLVALVDGRYVVDLNAGQMCRPGRSIQVPRAVVIEDPAFCKGRSRMTGQFLASGSEACQILYRRGFSDLGYRNGPDWRQRKSRVAAAMHAGWREYMTARRWA